MGRPVISDETRFGMDMVVIIKIADSARIGFLNFGHPALPLQSLLIDPSLLTV